MQYMKKALAVMIVSVLMLIASSYYNSAEARPRGRMVKYRKAYRHMPPPMYRPHVVVYAPPPVVYRKVWVPGYWRTGYRGRVWVPGYWTRRGC
jgi:hypothetical protein